MMIVYRLGLIDTLRKSDEGRMGPEADGIFLSTVTGWWSSAQ